MTTQVSPTRRVGLSHALERDRPQRVIGGEAQIRVRRQFDAEILRHRHEFGVIGVASSGTGHPVPKCKAANTFANPHDHPSRAIAEW